MILEVDRTDIRTTRVTEEPTPALATGQIRLAVERFALTSNNVTYAMSGDLLGYWDFFPADGPPWGRVPAMGLGSVVESAHEDIATGGRYFGFFPMTTHHVLDARPRGEGFRDTGAHRSDHAPAYVEFTRVDTDPGFRTDRADEFLLLRGLFVTSYLVDDFLVDRGHGETRTLVTSASSKTSIALAHCLAARGRPGVGVTSERNAGFCEGLGLYASVVTYDDVESLDASVPSTVVDMAGNSEALGRIHTHLADALAHSCQVGATHWEAMTGPAPDLPGPTPEFFFAPAQMQKRNADWGPGELDRRISEAFVGFVEEADTWLTVRHSMGSQATAEVWAELVGGATDPAVGHVCTMDADIDLD
ncbi:MAG: DUF2855 family protein [Actinomycetota bacterium]